MVITRLLLIGILCLSVVPASAADDPAQANRLLVEAVKLIQDASTKQDLTEQLPLLENALAKLNEIVEKHPSSDLAVKLITGQKIGTVSLTGLAMAIDNLKREAAEANMPTGKSACLKSLDTTDPECREWLYDIARAQLQAGDLEAALETAKSRFMDFHARRLLLRDIAEKQEARVETYLQAGSLEGALATAKSMEDTRARTRAFNMIAQGQAELVDQQLQAGNLEGALTTAESIPSGEVRAQALHAIARRQVEMVDNHLQAGNLEDALTVTKSIAYIVIRDQAFHDIAKIQAQAGNFDDAMATAKSIELDHLRDQILDVIRRQAQ